MTANKNQTVSASKKSKSTGALFEALESRQLMSASVSHTPAAPTPDAGHDSHISMELGSVRLTTTIVTAPIVTTPIVTKPIVTKPIVTKPIVTKPIVTTPIRYIPIHLPTFFIEPKVDGSVTHWENVSKDPLFAPGGPSPKDVVQNQAADCWYLSTLAEVALRDPSAIKNSISQRSDGTYDVYFHTSPTTTVDEHVDGELPLNGYNGLEYAQLGQDNCTWVAIMEKGLTYFRNRSIAANYATINYGSGSEALKDLGGTPSELLGKVSNASQLFTDVLWGLIFNTSMDFGTNSSSGPLVGDHEYSVISARDERGIDQIELRNPWGYNPNYSSGSSNYDSTNDGYIWVSASSVLPELDEFVSCAM